MTIIVRNFIPGSDYRPNHLQLVSEKFCPDTMSYCIHTKMIMQMPIAIGNLTTLASAAELACIHLRSFLAFIYDW